MRKLSLIISLSMCLPACGGLDPSAPAPGEAVTPSAETGAENLAQAEGAAALHAAAALPPLAAAASRQGQIDLDNGRLAPGTAELRVLGDDGAIGSYHARIPAAGGDSERGAALVVVLPSTSEPQREAITQGFAALTDEAHVVVAYPRLSDDDAPRARKMGDEHVALQDVRLLRAVMDDLQRRVAIDPRRLFVVAHGSRLALVQSLICEKADLVAALVSYGSFGELAPCAQGPRRFELAVESATEVSSLAKSAWSLLKAQSR